jgi:hypothetical protein
MLTGQTLYEGEASYQLLMQAAIGWSPETDAKIAKLSPALAEVMRKSICTREDRFQSAAEFEQALAALPAATGSELRKIMDRLFGDDLKAEEARLAAVQIPQETGNTLEWGDPAPGEEEQPT